MVTQKKDAIVIVLSIGLIISTFGNFILITEFGVNNSKSPPHDHGGENLIVGTLSGPVDLDPVDSWDSASWDVINQVCEGLLFYNYSDPELPLTPLLATNFTFLDSTHIDFTLRTGVTFHDGTAFNADAAKWNFDRLMHFLNHTGTLADGLSPAKIHSLFEFVDGSPIIADVVKIGDFTIQIHLNGPYSSILGLLAFAATRMLSPTYHEAQGHLDTYIDTSADLIVGTGPYEYIEYVTDNFVRLKRFDNYWMEPVMFDELILDVIDDSTTRNYAMLAGDIDYLIGSHLDFWDWFNESPYITFKEMDKPGLSYHYLGMNNKQINVTWRKAISYAVNYTYILQDMWEGSMVKSYGPVSPGFSSYFDDLLKLKAPYYNLTIARQTIIDDPGINTTGLSASINPHDVAWESANLTIFNFSYNNDNWFRADLYFVLKEWLLDIGIILEDAGTDWPTYILFRYFRWYPPNYDEYQLFWRAWGPDYLDPMNIITPIFSNTSIYSNAAQVNDPILEKMITDYLSETLEAVRIATIKNITEYLATELYPHAFGYHPRIRICHAVDLYGVAYNVAGVFWAYPIKRNLTWAP